MVFGFTPECRSDSIRNMRSASPESPLREHVEFQIDTSVAIWRECNASPIEVRLFAVLHKQINSLHTASFCCPLRAAPDCNTQSGNVRERRLEADQQRWYSLSRSCLPQFLQRRGAECSSKCFTRLLCERKPRRQTEQRNGRSGTPIVAPFCGVRSRGHRGYRSQFVVKTVERFFKAGAIEADA